MDEQMLAEELHQALAHLDDPPYLENLTIAKQIARRGLAPELSRGQALRRALRLAIASLDPHIEQGPKGLSGRAFQVLYRYAINRDSMIAIGSELGISSRQCYRELQRATDALMVIIHGMLREETEQSTDRPNALRQELARLSSAELKDIDVFQVVQEAMASISHLATERGVEIRLDPAAATTRVVAHRVMLRQAILNLLSHVMRNNAGQEIRLRLRSLDRETRLEIEYVPQSVQADSHATSPNQVATALLGRLGGHMIQEELGNGALLLALSLPASDRCKVLVVDDNPDLARLYMRYLRDQPYQIHAAQSSQQAEQLLAELKPDILVLDIMMPDRDGWELLEELRSTDDHALMRIVVCSIIDDPDLARALGADAFLHKPITRQNLIETLEAQWHAAHSVG